MFRQSGVLFVVTDQLSERGQIPCKEGKTRLNSTHLEYIDILHKMCKKKAEVRENIQ